MTSTTDLFRQLHATEDALKAHDAAAAQKRAELSATLAQLKQRSRLSAADIDLKKIDQALAVLSIQGTYSKAGDDRASCVSDAIKQLASGKPIDAYKDLWKQYFGTKIYDRWYGQRSDHPYGYGPRHGSVIFAIGLTKDACSRAQSDLTSDEVEAAIYYLANIERIENVQSAALVAAE